MTIMNMSNILYMYRRLVYVYDLLDLGLSEWMHNIQILMINIRVFCFTIDVNFYILIKRPFGHVSDPKESVTSSISL